MDKYLSKKYLQRMIDKWKSQYEDFESENKNSKLRKKLILKGYNECETIIEQAPTIDVVEVPEIGVGDLSDGYHTFNELYHHRAVLFSVICNSMPNKAWKSKLHDTGDMFEGMFIVGIETPDGQATYHYDINPYWDMFKVKELEKAPKWDGHTSTDAINRIANITTKAENGHWIKCQKLYGMGYEYVCSICEKGVKHYEGQPICSECGAKMDKQ